MNPLQHPGPASSQTRSALRRNYLLQTPDTFVRVPLPGIVGGEAVIHAAPALGAKFLQYTAELSPKGKLAPSANQRFLYLLSGEASVIGPGVDQTVGRRVRLYAADAADYVYRQHAVPLRRH